MPDNLDDLQLRVYPLPRVADLLGVSREVVDAMVADGSLLTVRLHTRSHAYVHVSELERIAAALTRAAS